MSTLQTFKLWLEPDRDIPQFKRLCWAMEPVLIRDVLLEGIHPWDGPNKHYTLADTVVNIINSDAGQMPEMEQFRYCYDINVPNGYTWVRSSRFERTLHTIHESLFFVENLSYLELLDIAKSILRRKWDHFMAREMARSACPGFQELRQFLKNKDKELKLSGYEDIDRYDLGKVLSLEDFSQRDSLIISTAIPTLNFRRASVLQKITDDQGRLRLTPNIRHLLLTETGHATNDSVLSWCVSGTDNNWRFRPDLGDSWDKRPRAEAFAKQWRTDYGRLCFTTTIDNLVAMVEGDRVMPSFPSLNYNSDDKGNTAAAKVHGAQVQAFRIGPFARADNTGEYLKDILGEYGVSKTGNKDKLVKKLAALTAEKYAEHLPELDQFFSTYRFLRMRVAPKNTVELPLLKDMADLRNLVLTMYAVKHLRGDTILESSHENDAYTDEELAHALITGKTDMVGAFLRVA